ncbi:MAG TPA: universal stress protein [Puia sp.]|nr:universal stress protein [Puia sp.]
MEKILLALDPQHINMNTIDFACYLSRLTHSRLTGVFLEDSLSVPVTHLPEKGGKGTTEESILTFKTACDCRGIQTLVHRDRGVPASEVVEESRFADVIIVDPETSFTPKNEPLPGRFVKDILVESECPVVIAPYSFNTIDDIIFSYNGTKSSVFAIKQFAYLFPELRQKKAIVVSVRDDGEEVLEEQFKIKEWMKDHYDEVEYVVLKGSPSDQLFGYLIERKNGIVVMGAYGRGMLSRLFKPSHARLIVKTINLPIFISHY